ncbi:MAG: c-type cytochrome [Gemmatimonadales bacterium]
MSNSSRAPLALLTLGLLAAPRLGAQAQSQPTPADSAALRLAQGKRIFEGKGLCFSCHGPQGEGMLGPTTRLAAGKVWLHVKGGTQAEIVTLVRAGIESEKSQSGTAMPSRGGARLTDAEVELVAAYVVELHKRTPTQ